MQLPWGNQRIVMQESAEQYVDHDVDCPNRRIGHENFSRLPQHVPKEQDIDRNRSGNDCPRRRTQALDAVSKQANKTADREGREDVGPSVDDVEADSP